MILARYHTGDGRTCGSAAPGSSLIGAVTAKFSERGLTMHGHWYSSTAGPRGTPDETSTGGTLGNWSKLATLAYTGSIGGREGERDGRVGAEA